MSGYYVLSEDDPEQAASIKEAIVSASGGKDVRVFHTELAAREFIDELGRSSAAEQNSLIGWIGDGMMLWDYPKKNPVQPDKTVKREGPVLAGERLRKHFRKHKRLQRIPWIVYSAIQSTTIGYSDHDKDLLNGFFPKATPVKDVIKMIDELRRRADSMKDEDFDDSVWPGTDEDETKLFRSNPELHQSIIRGLKTSWADCEALALPLVSLKPAHA